ncbi:MAG TPA: peptidase, partial [Actinomycetes bacterium]
PSRIAIDVSTASGSGSGGTSGGTPEGPGSLPFTGSRNDHLVLEGLGLLAVGLVTLLLARRTRRA